MIHADNDSSFVKIGKAEVTKLVRDIHDEKIIEKLRFWLLYLAPLERSC